MAGGEKVAGHFRCFRYDVAIENSPSCHPAAASDPDATGAYRPEPSTPPPAERFTSGALLAGRYRVIAVLGKGGMGEVYRADDLTLGQPVALKRLPPHLAAEPDRLTRLAATAANLSAGEARSGTPLYQAPEQLAGREVTFRSDLFAPGLVLYGLFTGKRAFAGAPWDTPPSKPSSHVSGLNPAVERVIPRFLEPEPANRPRSAAEVLSGPQKSAARGRSCLVRGGRITLILSSILIRMWTPVSWS